MRPPYPPNRGSLSDVLLSRGGVGTAYDDTGVRGARARAHAPEGTGLGLAIAHTIVERYRGTITVTPSNTNGHGGCTVTVRIPISVESRNAAARQLSRTMDGL